MNLSAIRAFVEVTIMPISNPHTDREVLTKYAYATDEHYAIRYRTHELYSLPRIDFPKWVVETLNWRGDEWVLDVGSGPGTYFEWVRQNIPDGRHYAGDLSWGMASTAREQAGADVTRILNLDVQHLPFPDGTFDVVMANHMLHHVPNLDQAFGEIRRVLRPRGILLAATNSVHTMPEFETLVRRAYTLLGYPKQDIPLVHHTFTLENGIMRLAQYFRAIARYDLPSAFHFPEVEPVLNYLNRGRPLREPHLPADVTWDEFMGVMEKQIARLINHFGELQVHKLTGVMVATNGGGFAEDFLEKLDG